MKAVIIDKSKELVETQTPVADTVSPFSVVSFANTLWKGSKPMSDEGEAAFNRVEAKILKSTPDFDFMR